MVVAVKEPFHLSIPSNADDGVCVTADVEKEGARKLKEYDWSLNSWSLKNLEKGLRNSLAGIISGTIAVRCNERDFRNTENDRLTTPSPLP